MSAILSVRNMGDFLRPYRTPSFLRSIALGLKPQAIMRCAFSTFYEEVLAQCKSVLRHRLKRTEGSQDLSPGFQPWVKWEQDIASCRDAGRSLLL